MAELSDGIYEQVISEAIQHALSAINSNNIEKEEISFDSSPDVFSRYIQKIILSGLNEIRERAAQKAKAAKLKDKEVESESISAQIDACNKIIEILSKITDSNELLEYKIEGTGERLLSVWNKLNKKEEEKIRPRTSISVSRLFTGGGTGFQLSDELNREIRSSNKVDFLVSFIKNSGINTIRSALKEFTENGGELRILTTTYMGTTEPNVIRFLARLPNTKVKISYDSQNTRLHAKSYIFERDNGYTTAYIGSSNLSKAAVTDGMEWNVKLTNQDAPQVIQEIKSTFEIYWNSKDFKEFDPENDYEDLCEIIYKEKNRDINVEDLVFFDIHPHPYQEELLQELKAQREVHNNWRNLVVAATGTGKTIVSAFDYKYFCDSTPGQSHRLLFIAHREEILKQSLLKFRAVMKNQNFGELFVGSYTARSDEHLFMSIQSFNSKKMTELPPDYYDFIIVDEVHHGSAESYQELLTYFHPKILLGLTATPERMDGMDIKMYFGNAISCEIRLPEAINRGLLVPFQYYAITDEISIESVKFERGKFSEEELTALYTQNDSRLDVIINALKTYQPDLLNIKCIGFCVSIVHAEYMANKFNEKGLKSIALTSHTDSTTRSEAQSKLARGELQFIFTVDLYNEGIDIPEVNTELMLRPTESKTIFIQQLGRGLRKAAGKSELIVLDFVGEYNKKYKVYEQKLRAMTSLCTLSVASQIKGGFQGLPAGCYIELEPVARDRILKNIGSDSTGKRDLIIKIKEYAMDSGKAPSLLEFLNRYELDPHDVYRSKKYSFTGLCIEAGVLNHSIVEKEITPSALLRSCDINSRRWISAIRRFLTTGEHNESCDEFYAAMLYFTFKQNALTSEYRTVWDFINEIRSENDLCNEFLQILAYNMAHIDFVDEPVDLGYKHTLDLYCSYTKDQILAALGKSTAVKPYPWREGVIYLSDKKTDVFIINLNKDEEDYSPTTMYEDYPISTELFHWQSQSGATTEKGDGLRYITQNILKTNTLLFVRKQKSDKNGTLPYVFLGKASYMSHEGNRPISIVWKMDRPIPQKVIGWSSLNKG